MNKPKAFVTGATGFLGKHVVKRLFELNYDISILARASSRLDELQQYSPTVIEGDINQTLTLLEATQGQDLVIHLAGLIAYKKSQRALMDKVNIQGTRNLMDACITNAVPKVVHLSSVVAIGASESPSPLDENTAFNLSQYDLGYFETKRSAEQIAMDAFEEHGLQVYIINPSTIYGAGDTTKGSRKTQLKVARGEFPFYTPGGVNVVYVNDVVDVIFKAMAIGKPGRRYIAAGENLTIKQLFEHIAEANGSAPPRWPLPNILLKSLGHLGDLMTHLGKETSLSSETAVTSRLFHWFDNHRVQTELGCQMTPAKTAINESVKWAKEHGYLES